MKTIHVALTLSNVASSAIHLELEPQMIPSAYCRPRDRRASGRAFSGSKLEAQLYFVIRNGWCFRPRFCTARLYLANELNFGKFQDRSLDQLSVTMLRLPLLVIMNTWYSNLLVITNCEILINR